MAKYTILYTIYKEPEHKELCRSLRAKEAKDVLKLSDVSLFYYYIKQIESGKLGGYSVAKDKRLSKEYNKDHQKSDEEIESFHSTMIQCQYGARADGAILCGDCVYWMQNKHRSTDMKLYGVCLFENDYKDRCCWCTHIEERKGYRFDCVSAENHSAVAEHITSLSG